MHNLITCCSLDNLLIYRTNYQNIKTSVYRRWSRPSHNTQLKKKLVQACKLRKHSLGFKNSKRCAHTRLIRGSFLIIFLLQRFYLPFKSVYVTRDIYAENVFKIPNLYLTRICLDLSSYGFKSLAGLNTVKRNPGKLWKYIALLCQLSIKIVTVKSIYNVYTRYI